MIDENIGVFQRAWVNSRRGILGSLYGNEQKLLGGRAVFLTPKPNQLPFEEAHHSYN